ncbi:hypothetical protein [Microbulbifer halophilus]
MSDVTDRSLAVIFTISEPAIPDLKVYMDEEASSLVPSVEVEAYPVHTGDPTISGQFRKHSKEGIASSARGRLIVKLEARGLDPETTYYLRPSATSEASEETTICPGSGAGFCDDLDAAALTVTTSASAMHTALDSGSGNTRMYLNDQLVIDTEAGSAGDLVIVALEGARYPVSAFVGDGIQAPSAMVDLNNLYAESAGGLLRVHGSSLVAERGDFGEAALVRLYRGSSGSTTAYKGVAAASGTGEVIALNEASLGDCNLSGTVGGYDQLLLHWVVDQAPQPDFQQQIAFHPVLCDLFKEEGLNSLSMSPEIDQEDLNRLKALLVGSISAEDLPEEPTP